MSRLYIEDISKNIPPTAVREEAREVLLEIQEVLTIYRSAIKELNTKLEVLSDEFQSKQTRSPISYIKFRVKTPQSIMEKLERRGYPLSLLSATENLHDIAGVRVICPFIDDIYRITKMLAQQSDLKILKVTDYMKSPKPNGYRSFHLIVELPVFFSDGPIRVKVELQIRTIAMDFWASLEHQLHYKDRHEIPQDIVDELTDCAEVIAQTDERMQSIHDAVAQYRDDMDF